MKQHFIPQFLLRNFAGCDADHLFVYDKQTGRVFSNAIGNIAAENGFYDFEADGGRHSLEPALGLVETRASEAIRSLIGDESTGRIPPEGRQWLAVFAALQFVRTRRRQNRSMDLIEALAGAVTRLGGDPAKTTLDGEPINLGISTEENRVQCLQTLGSLTREYAAHFDNKAWVLHQASAEDPFLIGDSPITLHNSLNQHTFKSTIGLGVPGIEINLPISNTLTLSFWCPTVEAFLRSTGLVSESYLLALEGKHPMPVTPEVTKHLNALQVAYAERFVYSNRKESFALVKEMITADSTFRAGLKDR